MTGSVGDAEDIVQDAFLGLTRARQAGTTITGPKAYLTTVVSRLGINYLRSAQVLLEALSPAERAVLGRRRQGAGDREAAGRAVVRQATPDGRMMSQSTSRSWPTTTRSPHLQALRCTAGDWLTTIPRSLRCPSLLTPRAPGRWSSHEPPKTRAPLSPSVKMLTAVGP